MSSTDTYQQRSFWETPDLSLLAGYLDKRFCEKVNEKISRARTKVTETIKKQRK